jgi:hypothetical protein
MADPRGALKKVEDKRLPHNCVLVICQRQEQLPELRGVLEALGTAGAAGEHGGDAAAHESVVVDELVDKIKRAFM